MPGTHRTPPDQYDLPESRSGVIEHLLWCEDLDRGRWGVEYATDVLEALERRAAANPATHLAPDALPALVAALAAHLSVDARRALTRDLAAQDGDAVVDLGDLDAIKDVLSMVSKPAAYRGLKVRLRAAVEAARPTPTPEETR